MTSYITSMSRLSMYSLFLVFIYKPLPITLLICIFIDIYYTVMLNMLLKWMTVRYSLSATMTEHSMVSLACHWSINLALFVNNQSSSSYYDKSSGHFACKLSRIKYIIIVVQNTLWSSVIILYS